MLLAPFFILMMAALGMGLGLIVSAVTTKYRDFALLLSFATSLLMYTCPVVYPLFRLDHRIRMLVNINPMTTIIEGLRYCFFQKGDFSTYSLIYTIVITLITFVGGLLVFNKVEKNFIDTI
jgi:lipopolysaccharide transport system permease protein